MNKIIITIILITGITGCSSKFDDEVTDITKCRISAQILGGEYEKNMREAYEFRAPKVKMVEFDMERIKYYQKLSLEIAKSDGTPDKEKVLSWYNSKYCKNMIEEFKEISK